MKYRVTKTYDHNLGLAATFRQHRAKSHCRFIHGYALGFKLVFEAETLDENGWVKDFGGLKPLKQYLFDTFDHKLLIARDDPQAPRLADLGQFQNPMYRDNPNDGPLADPMVVEAVGCEGFARMVWNVAESLITTEELLRGVRLIEVECREHAGNAASYFGGEVRER